MEKQDNGNPFLVKLNFVGFIHRGKMYNKQQIIDKIDLRALVEEAGGVFGKDGKRATCPLHKGDNPTAFALFEDKKQWYSFTQQCGGNVIDFYMKWRNVDFKTALAELARRAGLESPPPSQFKSRPGNQGQKYKAMLNTVCEWAQAQLWKPENRAITDYLMAHRGWREDTIRAWGVGYNPNGRKSDRAKWGTAKDVWVPAGIVYPHRRNGQAFWYNVRRPLPDSPLARAMGRCVTFAHSVKWMGAPVAMRRLNGLDMHGGAFDSGEILILVEGEPDLVTAWQELSLEYDVASLGGAGQGLNIEDANYLTGYKRIIAIYDNDAAGQAGVSKLQQVAKRIEAIAIPGPEGSDITDYCRAGGNLSEYVYQAMGYEIEGVPA